MKILYLSMFAAIFLASSCGPEAQRNERHYIVQNNSEVKVKVMFYQRISGDFSVRTSGILNSGEQFRRDIIQSSPFNDNFENYIVRAFAADSVRLIFDDKKVLTQFYVRNPEEFSHPIDNNLFKQENYGKTNNNIFLFKISEEHYENAIPCNENCE